MIDARPTGPFSQRQIAPNAVVTYHPHHAGVAPGQIAVGASVGGALVGIALADVELNAGTAAVQSIVVSAAHRGRGIAQGLLGALERRARDHGSTRLEAKYSGSRACAPTVAHVLAKAGWTATGAPTWILDSSIRIAEAPWMNVPVPDEYEIFAWAELSERESLELASPTGAARSCPAPLGPFPDEPVEPACSVGVRCGGRVVGWMLTHRIHAGLVRYSRLFVDEAHRRRFCGFALVTAALRRQLAAGIPNCMCAVSGANASMMRIVRRRLAPRVDANTQLCCAYKVLG